MGLFNAATTTAPLRAGVPPRVAGQASYVEILKSTALIGGSTAASIVLGIIRTKVMALLIGPSGVGLIGLYGSVADVAQSLAGLGLQSSGVRQIAEAAGSRDVGRVERTATALGRVSLAVALLGAALLVIFARPISLLTFGTAERTAGVGLLSLAVFFRVIAAGQGALLQGLRHISELARMNVLAAVFGTLVGLPVVYLFREDGVVPSLVVVAAMSLLTSWWYRRKVHIETRSMTFAELSRETRSLLMLGGAFMASAFLTMGAAYAIRVIVMHSTGLTGAGLYQAAWTLGGLYVGFILQAMGADFYPRLTGIVHDHSAGNRLVNEQAHVSLLLAGPGVIATLTLAPLVVALFYTPEFAGATDLLRWICLGMLFRVVAFPMGYIVLAKGAQQLFFWTEVIATVVHVGLAWLLVGWMGINGAGAAFFGLYAWHAGFIYVVVRRLTGFRWSSLNIRLGAVYLGTTVLVFCSFYVLPSWLSTALGLAVAALTSMHSAKSLAELLPPESIPGPVLSWMTRVGLARVSR